MLEIAKQLIDTLIADTSLITYLGITATDYRVYSWNPPFDVVYNDTSPAAIFYHYSIDRRPELFSYSLQLPDETFYFQCVSFNKTTVDMVSERIFDLFDEYSFNTDNFSVKCMELNSIADSSFEGTPTKILYSKVVSFDLSNIFRRSPHSASISPSVSSSVSASSSVSPSISVSPSVSASVSASTSLSSSVSASVSASTSLSSSSSASSSPSVSASISASSSISPSISASISNSISSSISASSSASAGSVDWYNASSLTLTVGSIVSGTLADTFSDNGVELILSEIGGAGPTFVYDFTFGEEESVPTYSLNANFKAWYYGNSAHVVKLQQWNYITSAWDNVTTDVKDFPNDVSEQSYTFLLLGSSNYISGGQIKLRIIHNSSGNINHQFHIDHLYLSEV